MQFSRRSKNRDPILFRGPAQLIIEVYDTRLCANGTGYLGGSSGWETGVTGGCSGWETGGTGATAAKISTPREISRHCRLLLRPEGQATYMLPMVKVISTNTNDATVTTAARRP